MSKIKKLFFILILLEILVFSSNLSSYAANFDKNLIISDENFLASTSMTPAQIQDLLKKMPGRLKSYSAPDYKGEVKSAAQIIFDASQGAGISPKVILVTLQKEKSLLTRPSPSQSTLDWAMGVASYGSRNWDSAYKGFGKQIWHGAQSLKTNRGYWRTGISRAYSDGIVNPINASTLSLYKYTPHVGIRGGGNKLFWTLYWKYFGDPLGRSTPVNGTLTINTTPVRGEVFIDGQSKGIAPLSLNISTGSHTVSFGTNYGYISPAKRAINISAGTIINVSGEYYKAKQLEGDFNGDGLTDIVHIVDDGNISTGIWLMRSDGNKLNLKKSWFSALWSWTTVKTVTGDFDGDRKDEIGAFYNYGLGETGLLVFDLEGDQFIARRPWKSGSGWG